RRDVPAHCRAQVHTFMLPNMWLSAVRDPACWCSRSTGPRRGSSCCCRTSSCCCARSTSLSRETPITITAIILAAGKGTRMRSARPKVLHTLAGWPMIAHVLVAVGEAGANRTLVVLGHDAATVRQVLPPGTLSVVQDPQRGTGHAVAVALAALPGDETDAALILYADMPLITPQTLRTLLHAHTHGGHLLSLLSAVVPDPQGYGRVLRDARGGVIGVKEQKELAPGEQALMEINCGVYCADMAWLRGAIAALPEHADGEYYLPDLVPMAAGRGGIGVVQARAPDEVQGVNTRVQLAAADRLMRARINEAHMLAGVTIVDPATTYVEPGVRIGQAATIYPNTHLRGATTIGVACAIGPDAEVIDRVVAANYDGVRKNRTVIGDDVFVGCDSILRAPVTLGDGSHTGAGAVVLHDVAPGTTVVGVPARERPARR